MPPHMPVTPTIAINLRHIARCAGVSRMTVSRALRPGAPVAQATRERIQQLAEAMGYRPHPRLREAMACLRQSRGWRAPETLAFAHVFCRGRQPRSITEMRVLEGASERAAQLGYHLDVFELGTDGMTGARLGKILRARGIRGLVLQATRGLSREVEAAVADVACAAVGSARSDLPLHSAGSHQAQVMRLAIERLRCLGFQNIGYYMMERIDRNIEHAWHSAWLHHSLTVGAPPSRRALLVAEWQSARFLAWWREQRLDAVVTIHAPALDWLRRAGINVPRSAGFAHLDWHPALEGVAGIDQKHEQAGAAAIDLVAGQLQNNERGVPEHARQILIRGSWRDGATVSADKCGGVVGKTNLR